MEYLKVLKNNNKIYNKITSYSKKILISKDFSIRFVFSGSEKCEVSNRRLTVYPDSFITLNKGTEYFSEIESVAPAELFSISYDEAFLSDFKHTLNSGRRDVLDIVIPDPRQDLRYDETIYPLNGDIRYTIRHLRSHIEEVIQDELLLNEYLYHVLLNYHRVSKREFYYSIGKLHNYHHSTREEIFKRLRLAREYLYSNYNQNISMRELSSYACMSMSHLFFTFKQVYQLSPHQVLMQIRLQRACSMLKETDFSVNEIVGVVGFESVSSFIRLFKRRFATTPKAYRQQ